MQSFHPLAEYVKSVENIKKIIMIIPTSQMIPFIINSISKNHKKWLILQECLNFLDYIFTHLNQLRLWTDLKT